MKIVVKKMVIYLQENEKHDIKINLDLLGRSDSHQNHRTAPSDELKEVQRIFDEKMGDACRKVRSATPKVEDLDALRRNLEQIQAQIDEREGLITRSKEGGKASPD